jgi:uncharacterized damage-inducible protein DinB
LRVLTDASLQKEVGPGARTLGRLGWHLVTSVAEMMERTGLDIGGVRPDSRPPAHAAEIVAAWEDAAASLDEQVRLHWSDAHLETEDDMYGERWKRGFTLLVLLLHQAHHRGQMTVLMRQAGLPVPGVHGPSREEWQAFGMQPPEV